MDGIALIPVDHEGDAGTQTSFPHLTEVGVLRLVNPTRLPVAEEKSGPFVQLLRQKAGSDPRH